MVEEPKAHGIARKVRTILAVTTWSIVAFFLAQVITIGIVQFINMVAPALLESSRNMVVVALSSFIYILMMVILLFLPRVIGQRSPSRTVLGIHKELRWRDIGLSLPAVVIYFVATTATLFLAMQFLPWMNVDQVQETGLSIVAPGGELIWIFLLLVVVGPIVEELIFRGYLYGKIRAARVPFWLTAIIVSVLFGLAHMQWNVGIDTFVLSMVMCFARELTGTIWTGVLMHMIKNGIAYYFLFINPLAISSLGLMGL